MKKIVKLRLINWHLFANETVDIANITFLTGANGTGKSTIIDAMQILLLGDTSGRNFNKAANDKTGRTLRGYLRCELGETADGKVMALRPGRFTSYIALEFFDDTTEKSFTLGIVFDSYEDESEDHHFFFLNSAFPSNNFTNSELLDKGQPRPLTYKELNRIVSESYEKTNYAFFDSNAMYQAFLKDQLGGLPDKYFTLFKKAVSFSPITNISSFITEFVCDIDYNIDISSMQKNIEQYKLLELEAKRLQVKIDALTSIEEAYDNYRKIDEDRVKADYVNDRANYEMSKVDVVKYEKELENKRSRVQEINASIAENEHSIEELKAQKEEYLAKKVNSKGYSLSAAIINKKNNVLEKISSINSNYQLLEETLSSYIKDYEIAIRNVKSCLTNQDDSFLSDKEKSLLDDFRDVQEEFLNTIAEVKLNLSRRELSPELVKEFQSEMQTYHTYALRVEHALEDQVFSLQGQISSLDNELREIKGGRKPFNQTYYEVREALKEALVKRHRDAEVLTYCDLVDIEDKSWTRAIEAAIFSQKFNLFVNDEYYEEANRLLANIANEYRYYQISLVDSEKLISRGFEAKKGSVAEEIVTTHEGARAYTNFLLGNVKKCDTFAQARESGNGLLRDCTGYRNFASWYLNKARAEISFIGTKLDNQTALNKKNEFSELSKRFEQYSYLLNIFEGVVALEVLNSAQCNTFAHDIASLTKIEDLDREVESYENELREGELKEVKEFDSKISAIDEDIKDIENENNSLRLELGGLMSQIRQLENDYIPTKRRLLDALASKLDTYDPVLVNEKFDPFFTNAMENLSLEQIVVQGKTHYVQTQNRLKFAREKLIDLRNKYVYTYNLSYDTSNLLSNDEFEKELNNLSEVLLPNYVKQIEQAHKMAIKEFKDDFIYKLRNSFETIRSQIDELNIALKEVRFGRDSYRFSVEPNKDYLEYYEMITDDLLLNVGDAEDVYLEKYQDTMNNLFNMISDSTSKDGDVKAQILENVQRFTDYRTYLVFDLLVRRGDNPVESSLARTFKRQSGGETQTPFYISILASFAQLYRSQDEGNNDTMRLVIFDEAFSKMDATRIKEAVGLLRSFGLQAILSTPSEKLRDLSKEVDLVLVTINDQKKHRSYIDKYKEIKR